MIKMEYKAQRAAVWHYPGEGVVSFILLKLTTFSNGI